LLSLFPFRPDFHQCKINFNFDLLLIFLFYLFTESEKDKNKLNQELKLIYNRNGHQRIKNIDTSNVNFHDFFQILDRIYAAI